MSFVFRKPSQSQRTSKKRASQKKEQKEQNKNKKEQVKVKEQVVIKSKSENLLNKRSEVFSRCCHRNRFKEQKQKEEQTRTRARAKKRTSHHQVKVREPPEQGKRTVLKVLSLLYRLPTNIKYYYMDKGVL